MVDVLIALLKALLPYIPELADWIHGSHAAGTLPPKLAPLIEAMPAKGTALEAVKAEEALPEEYK